MIGEARTAEVVIVGAGILGAAVAYALAQRGIGKVVLLEAEDTPNRHSTGRNAAYFLSVYDAPAFSDLAQASLAFLRSPPEGFAPAPLLEPRGAVIAELAGREGDLDTELADARRGKVEVDLVSEAGILELVPIARPGAFGRALYYPEAGPLDVHALWSGYLAAARRGGGRLLLDEPALAIDVEGGRVRGVRTRAGPISCGTVVNAAGAWAGLVGDLVGAQPILIEPRRRHIVALPLGPDLAGRTWPFLRCPGLPLYCKPDSGQLLASIMDEEPEEPGDCMTDDLVVAATADRVAEYTTLPVRRIARSWAGHRTFSRDGLPVLGRDSRVENFVWAAALGGAGVMSSPAVGQIVADVVAGGVPNPTAFDPGRPGLGEPA